MLSLFDLERFQVVIFLDEKYQYLKLLYIWRGVSAALASSVSSRHHSVLRGCCDLLGWLKKQINANGYGLNKKERLKNNPVCRSGLSLQPPKANDGGDRRR
jgi:hypothetical protein